MSGTRCSDGLGREAQTVAWRNTHARQAHRGTAENAITGQGCRLGTSLRIGIYSERTISCTRCCWQEADADRTSGACCQACSAVVRFQEVTARDNAGDRQNRAARVAQLDSLRLTAGTHRLVLESQRRGRQRERYNDSCAGERDHVWTAGVAAHNRKRTGSRPRRSRRKSDVNRAVGARGDAVAARIGLREITRSGDA